MSTPPAPAAPSYKDTLNLLDTPFAMRANARKREPELQAFWSELGLYDRLSRHNPGAVFTLHDGPPYANGALHVGHALNKILKDIINKHALLQAAPEEAPSADPPATEASAMEATAPEATSGEEAGGAG